MFNFSRKITYLLHSKITEIYATHSIRSFALSMIAIFIPIFFLEQGYSLTDVVAYFLIRSTVVLFTNQWFVKFAGKYGIKKSMIISLPSMAVMFFALFNIQSLGMLIGKNTALALIAVISITSQSFYWMAFHLDFSNLHEEKIAAKQVSWLQSLSVIFSILGPFIGATLIVSAGFNTAFIIISMILLLAIIPLLFSKERHEAFHVEFKNIFSPTKRSLYKPYFGEGFRFTAAAYFWPIMLYLLAINISEIGGIYTLSSGVLAAFTLFIGKISNDGNQHRILKFGTTLHSFSLILRTLLKTISTIAAVQSLGAISFSMIKTPYDAYHYNRSKRLGIAQTIYSREIYLHLGMIMCLSTFLFAFFLTQNEILSLSISIMISALVMFLMNSINKE